MCSHALYKTVAVVTDLIGQSSGVGGTDVLTVGSGHAASAGGTPAADGRPSPPPAAAAAAAAAAASAGVHPAGAAAAAAAASAGGTADAAAGTGTEAPPESDCSKDWMFSGTVARRFQVHWDADANLNAAEHASELRKKVTASLPEIGEDWKTTFSENAPEPIEYAVIVSDIDEVTADADVEDQVQDEYWLFVPIRGYVITALSVHGNAWKESIPLCDEDGKPLTWTKSLAISAAGPRSVLMCLILRAR